MMVPGIACVPSSLFFLTLDGLWGLPETGTGVEGKGGWSGRRFFILALHAEGALDEQ